jgi:hypothetical protein
LEEEYKKIRMVEDNFRVVALLNQRCTLATS